MEEIKKHVDAFVKTNITTKDAVAKGIGMSRSSFYEKLAGKSPWMLDEAIALADFMGITISQLIS